MYSTIILLLLSQLVNGQVGLVNHGAVIHVGSSAAVYIKGGEKGNYYNKTANSINGKLKLNGKLIIEGGWFNNATGDSALIDIDADGTVAFVNGGTQIIGGTRETKFENVSIENNTIISLSRDTYIKNQLILVDGIVETNSDSLIIENRSESAIVGQSEDNFVCGNLRRYITEGSFDYPLEYGGYYLPVTVEVSDVGSMNFVSAKFTPSSSEIVPEGLSVNGTAITKFLDGGYWTFSPDNGDGVEYDITLTSRGHSNGGDEPEQHAIFKRDNSGSPWEDLGDHDNSTQSGSGTDAITVKRSNLTGFSDFIIGHSNSTPLPINLVDFYGQCEDTGIKLIWETASEFDNDYFTVYYSYDGIEFTTLDKVLGAGNSQMAQYYSRFYRSFTSETVYFKLSQTNYNGEQVFFDIISVHCPLLSDNSMQCFGIGKGSIRVNFASAAQEHFKVCVFDAMSRMIWIEDVESVIGQNTKDIYLNDYAAGMYIVTLYNNTQQFSKKIILE